MAAAHLSAVYFSAAIKSEGGQSPRRAGQMTCPPWQAETHIRVSLLFWCGASLRKAATSRQTCAQKENGCAQKENGYTLEPLSKIV